MVKLGFELSFLECFASYAGHLQVHQKLIN